LIHTGKEEKERPKGKGMVDIKRVRGIIPKMVEKIVEEYQPKKIILFGSYTYGEPTGDSDIDILVVTEGRLSPKETYKVRHKLLRDFSIPVQLIFVSEEEFMETKKYYWRHNISRFEIRGNNL
jgi:Predicted nucleotidyltransferases